MEEWEEGVVKLWEGGDRADITGGHLMILNSCCNKRKVYQRMVDGRSSVLQAAA